MLSCFIIFQFYNQRATCKENVSALTNIIQYIKRENPITESAYNNRKRL